MASRILLDEHMGGYLEYLETLAFSTEWAEIAADVELEFVRFSTAGLRLGTNDRLVWLHCQEHGFYLLTENRKMTGADSLEEVLRELNSETSLPVFTVGDRSRLDHERSYGVLLIEKLLERLLYPDNLRGAGRLFVP